MSIKKLFINFLQRKPYKKCDRISAKEIQKHLTVSDWDINIETLPCTSSTNKLLREKVRGGASEGYLLVANEQSCGRGRLGRSFFSPKDTGIYMSMLLKPQSCTGLQATKITTIAAVAISEAIEAISGEDAKIKWVNDIFVRNKKVCGILTEGVIDTKNKSLDYAVLGVGINVYQPEGGFPDDLKNIAGSILPSKQKNIRNLLIAEFLNRFFMYYRKSLNGSCAYVDEYRKRSLVIGKDVLLVSSTSPDTATVIDIDNECRLKVRYKNGTEKYFSSGEISIKI